ncbi:pre-tRNA nuclear export protein [Asimina triloba]
MFSSKSETVHRNTNNQLQTHSTAAESAEITAGFTDLGARSSSSPDNCKHVSQPISASIRFRRKYQAKMEEKWMEIRPWIPYLAENRQEREAPKPAVPLSENPLRRVDEIVAVGSEAAKAAYGPGRPARPAEFMWISAQHVAPRPTRKLEPGSVFFIGYSQRLAILCVFNNSTVLLIRRSTAVSGCPWQRLRPALVKFTIEELRRILDKKHNIRNMFAIAHVDHGKSTLTDSLVAAAGIIAQEVAGDVRMTNSRQDEAQRGITIKSTGISLYYEMTDDDLKNYEGERSGNEYLINLIDSPGHVDFSSEVTAAFRITDGALVVVDCVEGVCVQTETVLRQALGERIRPVLTVNKMDRCFIELQVEGEEAYQAFLRVIENANVIMATYEDPLLGDVQVYPEKGTVTFSAVDESKRMERFWGENYFDTATKKWTSKNTGSPTCKRGFVQFYYELIKQIINTCMNDQKDKLWPMPQKLGVTMKADEKELMGKASMKRVMQTWLPASNALL